MEKIPQIFPKIEREKNIKTITFLGRNTEGILSDAKNNFSNLGEIEVIAREGDKFDAPNELQKIEVNEFVPDKNVKYIIIVNGGTSQQLLPTIKKMVENGIEFEAYDLQKDGITRVW